MVREGEREGESLGGMIRSGLNVERGIRSINGLRVVNNGMGRFLGVTARDKVEKVISGIGKARNGGEKRRRAPGEWQGANR